MVIWSANPAVTLRVWCMFRGRCAARHRASQKEHFSASCLVFLLLSIVVNVLLLHCCCTTEFRSEIQFFAGSRARSIRLVLKIIRCPDVSAICWPTQVFAPLMTPTLHSFLDAIQAGDLSQLIRDQQGLFPLSFMSTFQQPWQSLLQ